MYRIPSRKKKKQEVASLNLIPILDAVFIFIFFLLVSANFIKVFEIPSDVPIISERSKPSKKKPLALTVKIYPKFITVTTGMPAVVRKKFSRVNGKYNLNELHNYLILVKKRNRKENTIIIEPIANIEYEELVQVMDSMRVLKNTDPAFFIKDKDGIDQRATELFNNLVFGNIQS